MYIYNTIKWNTYIICIYVYDIKQYNKIQYMYCMYVCMTTQYNMYVCIQYNTCIVFMTIQNTIQYMYMYVCMCELCI